MKKKQDGLLAESILITNNYYSPIKKQKIEARSISQNDLLKEQNFIDQLMQIVNEENKKCIARIKQYYETKIHSLNYEIFSLRNEVQRLQILLVELQNRQINHNHDYKSIYITPLDGSQSIVYQFKSQNPPGQLKQKKIFPITKSIVSDVEDFTKTEKKQSQFMNKKNFLFDKFQSNHKNEIEEQQNCFEQQLNKIKSQIKLFRYSLEQQGFDLNFRPNLITNTKIDTKILEVQQSKNMKSHLINENNKLRNRSDTYKNQLKSIQPHISDIKNLLISILQSQI